MNRTDTAQVLAVLAAAYPYVNVTRETAEVWHDLLSDLDADACRGAVRDLLLTAERWPSPATVRRRVAERAGLLAPSGGQAWGEVQTAARESGWTGAPVWSHPAIAAAVAALGWRNICLSEMPDTMRAHFLRAYETEARAADERAVVCSLTGLGASVGRSAIEAAT